MKPVSKTLVMIFWVIIISLPGTCWADFTLVNVFGGQWQNDPPTGGPITKIDTFIEAGNYTFTGNGTNYFSNTGSTVWTSTLINQYWTEAATNPGTPFTGNMTWNYDFAGTYMSGSLITLALNYYNKDTFVIAEEWTWGSSGWTGGTSTTPLSPVPIPASALLLGTGLLGMGLLGFRRKSD